MHEAEMYQIGITLTWKGESTRPTQSNTSLQISSPLEVWLLWYDSYFVSDVKGKSRNAPVEIEDVLAR
jgi:hypothetical protein